MAKPPVDHLRLAYSNEAGAVLYNQEREPGGTGNDGDGTSNAMEARVAKLEAIFEGVAKDIRDIKDDVRELRRDARGDFRLLFGAIIAVAIGLAGLMAKGFNWI